jgi:ribosomal protein S1
MIVVKVGDIVSAMVTRVENNEGYTVYPQPTVVEFEARERLAQAGKVKKKSRVK